MKNKSKILSSIILGLLLNSQIALAANDIAKEGYCLSESKYPFVSMNASLEVSFTSNNILYKVDTCFEGICLFDSNNLKLDSLKIEQQEETKTLNKLIMSKKGLLLIDCIVQDFIVQIVINHGKASFSELQKLPQIYEVPKSYFSDPPNQYNHINSIYSSGLDRFFLEGFQPALFGKPKSVVYEIMDGKIKLLPKELLNARLLRWENNFVKRTLGSFDIFKGELFQSDEGKLFFYDGANVTLIKDQHIQKDGYKNSNPPKYKKYKWRFEFIDSSQRVFITAFYPVEIYIPFKIYELKPSVNAVPTLVASSDDLSKLNGYGFYKMTSDPEFYVAEIYNKNNFNTAYALANMSYAIADLDPTTKQLNTILSVRAPLRLVSLNKSMQSHSVEIYIDDMDGRLNVRNFNISKTISANCLVVLNKQQPLDFSHFKKL
jgi:hypothetical protein